MYVQIALLLFLVGNGYGRDLWSADLPEVSGFVLEKGKPIQLSDGYESVQIAELKGTLFSDSLSKLNGVRELRIKRHELKAVENGALCTAPDLKILELNFGETESSLNHLTKEMFENCGKLEELILTFQTDTISYTIDKDAFENLTGLKKFIIHGYKIDHLTKDFFKLSPSLTTIVISFADIEQIDSDVFEGFRNIENIIIDHNRKWNHLPKDLFKNLPKLKSLWLRDNGLKDLSWDEFEDLSAVRSLRLSSNEISSFDANKISKNMPNLEQISIESNPGKCIDKEAFVEELMKKLGHPLEATYKFDPGFYDPCLHGE